MKEQIKKLVPEKLGFARAEIFSDLAEYLKNSETAVMTSNDIQKRTNPFLEYEWVKTFIVGLFPYFSGGERTEISRYAWGKDYHAALRGRLSPVCAFLAQNGYKAEILCDNHNLNDRYLAYKAGLGFFGRNGFLINDDYGTYVFIASIATDAEIEPDIPVKKSCMNCGECRKKCPGGAISEKSVQSDKCVSYITQKKGVLTEDEKYKIKKSGYIWGCDICQEVCPHNLHAQKTDIGAFKNNLIKTLDIDPDISNRQFRRKYSDRAFAWRGKQTILRNIDLFKN